MFEGLWSRQTHPRDYPANEWLTHFSDIIGASHSADYRVWEYGGIASDGLRQVAEWGSTQALESELKSEVEFTSFYYIFKKVNTFLFVSRAITSGQSSNHADCGTLMLMEKPLPSSGWIASITSCL